MQARSIIIDLMAGGYTRQQIAKQAKVTPAAISHILNGKVKTVHGQTLSGLAMAHSVACRKAQKRLEASQDALVQAEVALASLKLAQEQA
jgi:transcriptional regulator with XRE-family HTH domain